MHVVVGLVASESIVIPGILSHLVRLIAVVAAVFVVVVHVVIAIDHVMVAG